MAQLVHEATVYGCTHMYLAVLFGGQELVIIPVEVTDQMKADHIERMAAVWAKVQAGETLPPEDTTQTKLLYPVSQDAGKMASQSVEQAISMLKDVKAKIKELEATEETLTTMVQGYMGEASNLVTLDGSVLATWKSAKPTQSFDAKLFQSAMPDLHSKFIMEKQGSRRFLVK